jgi:Bacteriophage Mu Gam like protein
MNNDTAIHEMNDLDPDIAEPTAPDGFAVTDESSVNWVIRKIVEARAYADRCEEWCRREQARAKREEEFFFFRFQAQLMAFARQKIAEHGGRRKSFFLPSGQIGFRTEPGKLIIDDDVSVLAWAKREVPDLVQVVERVAKSDLNDLMKRTGQLPDAGAHLEPSSERFFIR